MGRLHSNSPNLLSHEERNILIEKSGCKCGELFDTWDHCICGKSPFIWDYEKNCLVWADNE